jgi:hypothetical protein
MLKLRDEDISFAFKQVMDEVMDERNKINWEEYLKLHNQDLLNFAAIEAVVGAEFKGPKGSEEFFKELANFRYIVNFVFSAIYSAMGKRLPKVEKIHIDKVIEKNYFEPEVDVEAELKRRHDFLGQLIPKWEKEMALDSFTRYAISLVLKSVFIAADEEIQWLDEKLKELKT